MQTSRSIIYCLRGQIKIQQYIAMFVNRLRSKTQGSSSSKRQALSAHYKTRGRMLTQSTHDAKVKQSPQGIYMKVDHLQDERQKQLFQRTAKKLKDNNFSHHDEGNCCCESCECGRHLCKFNLIKPGFTKKSIYKRSYYKKRAINNEVNHDKEYDTLKGPHLDLKSTYTEGFKPIKGDDLDRPHPQDLLHPNGPIQQITSYSNQFPGFRGTNQYVKPTNKHSIGYFPLRSKSTYEKQYAKKDIRPEDYTYIPDQLKTGSNWFGKTTYDDFYGQPNSEYFAKKVKVVEKLQKNIGYSRQFQTVYKSEFIEKQNPLCPAKVFLQTKGQGVFQNSKGQFTENSDFKAMQPRYHAISSSKHYYV